MFALANRLSGPDGGHPARPSGARLRLWRAGVALLAALLALPVAAFDLQGHRGARGLLPENTLAGFEKALELGVTTLELDVVVTADGVLVVHHDRGLNPAVTRDAAGRWLERSPGPIHGMTWTELQRFDVGRIRPGTRYAAQFAEQQPLDGSRVPRLSDLFALVKQPGNGHVRLAIETKLSPLQPQDTPPPEAFARALVDAVQAAGLAPRTQILSFDWRTLQVVQRIAPEIATVYLTAQQSWLDNVGAAGREASPWTAGFRHADHGSVPRLIQAAGGRIWSAFHGDLDAAQVSQAHALGLRVLAWTVNDAAQMGRLIDIGVDGLITDRPDIARQVLRERGIVPR